MQVVNGYPCFTCEDVDVARRGVDPSTRFESPAVIAARHPGKAAAVSDADPGNPAVNAAVKVEPPRGVNEPLSSGDRGTILNLLV
jgi:hypothetical protein